MAHAAPADLDHWSFTDAGPWVVDEDIARDMGVDPEELVVDLESIAAIIGGSDGDKVSYRDLQARRKDIQKKMEGQREAGATREMRRSLRSRLR